MSQRSQARHSGTVGAGLGLDLGEKVLEVVHAHLGVGHIDRRHGHQIGNRQQLAFNLAGAFVEQGVDGGRAHGSHANAVAVWSCLGDGLAADQTPGAALVVHDHRLPQRGAHAFGNHAGHDVGGAAGGKRHDELDRLAWIGVSSQRLRRS